MPRKPIGTFTKDGREKVAYSQVEVVQLKFEGWLPSDAAAEAAVATTRTGPTPPPISGKGSGTQAWADYADSLGVSVADDADRDAIVQAVSAAGHPVEVAAE